MTGVLHLILYPNAVVWMPLIVITGTDDAGGPFPSVTSGDLSTSRRLKW